MDKIKSVLHGHKKDQDAAHDPPRAQQGKHAPPGQPTYNVKTTSGAPYTELAHSNASPRPHGHESHGQPEYLGTDGATGTDAAQSSAPTSAPPTGNLRPDPQPHSHVQESSIASIKSGVIGFGPTESQGHAAISTHNPSNTNMAGNQVVGGGSPGTAGMTPGRGTGPGAHTDSQTHVVGPQPAATGLSNYASEPQPYESILRQESYTADTDRSFPLAGGVTSNPQEHPSHASHARQGLADTAVAATAIGASHTMSKSEEKDIRSQGAETRQATYGDSPSTTVPNTNPQAVTGVVSQPETEHYPTVLPAAATVASNASSLPSAAQEKRLETDSTGTILPTTEPIGNCERPINPRLESRHRHIPGEYIATPSDEPNMFMNYDSVMEPASSRTDANAPVQSLPATAAAASSESPMDPAPNTGTHELRHTGTLEEPRPRSADSHHARDTAIAGGLLAGAAGLGAHEASQSHERRDVRSDSLLYDDPSPYAGKTLDPRVLGDSPKMDEQRFDPKAKAAHPIDPAVSGPLTSHGPSRDNVATGVGAARDSAEDVVEAYTNHRMTQAGASMPEQRYDPAVSSARASNPVTSSQYDYNNPAILGNFNRTDPNDHVNRNAAFTGAGLAGVALGAGAYAREPHPHATQQLPLRQKEDYAAHTQGGPVSQSAYPVQDTTQTSWPLPDASTHMSYPGQGTIAPHNTHVEDPTLQPYGAAQKPATDEHGKHKSAMLGGAVGAAGLGGAAYMDHRYQNQQEADDRLRKIAREREEEERLRERQFGKERETDEKKHKVLGFLHRDKSKRERSSASPESSPRHSKDHSARNSKDYAEDSDSPRWKGKHLLHKDPPKGHPAREVLEKSHHADPYAMGKREHMGTDGPIGIPDAISGDRETRKGVYGAHPATDLDHNPTVLEPHTGLPMNTEQYGTGFGGTDGNPAIRGQHDHPGAMAGHNATNWEAIKKADTPY